MIRETELALGTRFKLLSETLYNQVDTIYHACNIPFQARWFPIIYLLTKNHQMSITEIAKELGVTHSAISQLTNKIIKNGVIKHKPDPKDERRRLLSLSKKGRDLCQQMQPVWQDILISMQEIITKSGFDLMKILNALERELGKRSLDALVLSRIRARKSESVEIIKYHSKFKKAFKQLNYEWLEKYFYVEKIDADVLSKPDEYILKKGGYIFFAKYNDEIVGTSALIKHEKKGFELSKMAVKEKYQGLQIGEKLADAAIVQAKSLGEQSIFLETNSKLTPALSLYKKLGFLQVDYPSGKSEHYQRSDTYMVLAL